MAVSTGADAEVLPLSFVAVSLFPIVVDTACSVVSSPSSSVVLLLGSSSPLLVMLLSLWFITGRAAVAIDATCERRKNNFRHCRLTAIQVAFSFLLLPLLLLAVSVGR